VDDRVIPAAFVGAEAARHAAEDLAQHERADLLVLQAGREVLVGGLSDLPGELDGIDRHRVDVRGLAHLPLLYGFHRVMLHRLA
jgi:hypothetical protein